MSTLVERGLLHTRAGIGTVVAAWRPAADPQSQALVAALIDRLVVDAKQLGLSLPEVLDAVRANGTRAQRGNCEPVNRGEMVSEARPSWRR